MKSIWFDMDGTLVDFYGVEHWLEYLKSEDTTPYKVAKPLLNLSVLTRTLNKLQHQGYKINIVSWTSRGGSDLFNSKIAEVKKEWLAKHLSSVKFDNIDIIKYGTPKQVGRAGILFDDEEPNRISWGVGAYNNTQIMQVLKEL